VNLILRYTDLCQGVADADGFQTGSGVGVHHCAFANEGIDINAKRTEERKAERGNERGRMFLRGAMSDGCICWRQ
jgi:hypothetical protein